MTCVKAQLLSPFLKRFQVYRLAVGQGTLRNKWLSGKDAAGPNVPVGIQFGHPENPIYHTRDKEYLGSPERGDRLKPSFIYRGTEKADMFIDRCLVYLVSAFLWFWISYHVYYYPGHILGHHYMPYLEEFTDEELGIPPDDAPDPEYWGNHFEKPGTYR